MPRIALLRGGVIAAVFAAGVAASLALTPQAQSRAADCVIGDICLTTTLPTVPLPTLPVPTGSTPTTTTTAAPTTTTTPVTTTSTSPEVPAEPGPKAQPVAALTGVRVTVTGKGAKRVLSLTLRLSRTSKVNLHVRFRPRAVRSTFTARAGSHVRKVRIPARTRAGRYLLTITIRSSEPGVETHRRTVSVRR